MDFASALSALKTARDISRGKPVCNNTRLHACKAEVDGVMYRAVGLKLHDTFVVIYLENGWYVLNTGGWDTVTTWRRINDYGPRHRAVHSTRGQGKVVGSPIGYTEPRVTKCRSCHGTGEIKHVDDRHTVYCEDRVCVRNPIRKHGYVDQWGNEVVFDIFPSGRHTSWKHLERVRHMMLQEGILFFEELDVTYPKCWGHWDLRPEPIITFSECWRCRGAGRADYGSKPIYIPFHDGIVVDSKGEWVSDNSRVFRFEQDWITGNSDEAFEEARHELLRDGGYASVA